MHSIVSLCRSGEPYLDDRDRYRSLYVGRPYSDEDVAEQAAHAEVTAEDPEGCLTKAERKEKIDAITEANVKALRRGGTTACLDAFYRRFTSS